MDRRKNDQDTKKTHFRAQSRVFALANDAWYFSSREGNYGPFPTEAEAKKKLEVYIKLMDVPEQQEEELTAAPERRGDSKVWERFDAVN